MARLATSEGVIAPPKWTTEVVKIRDLIEWEQNPVFLSKHDAEEIKKSLQKFGMVIPLVANAPLENGTRRLIDGHQRKAVMAWAQMAGGDDDVEVRVPDRMLTELECDELSIRLRRNQGEFDWDRLANMDIDDLLEWGFTQDEFEWHGVDIEVPEILDGDGQGDPEADNQSELPPDALGGVNNPLWLKKVTSFPSSNELGIPDLLPEMLYQPADDVGIYVGHHTTAHEEYLWNYQNSSAVGMDFTKTILCFYTYDEKFDPIWEDYPDYIEKWLAQGWRAVVSPNWSLFPFEPRVVQLYNIYKSRFIGRYLQAVGMKVIPDLDWNTIEEFQFNMLGIPVGLPCLSVQLQTNTKFGNMRKGRIEGLNVIAQKLKPESIMIYGAKATDKLDYERAMPAKIKRIYVESVNQRLHKSLGKRKKIKRPDEFIGGKFEL